MKQYVAKKSPKVMAALCFVPGTFCSDDTKICILMYVATLYVAMLLLGSAVLILLIVLDCTVT